MPYASTPTLLNNHKETNETNFYMQTIDSVWTRIFYDELENEKLSSK